MLEALLKNCKSTTRLCIAVDLTGKSEWIKTKTIENWRKEKVDIHKRLVFFYS
jgi:16S rRNA (cytidine1402-2'-O)-methyltransferase